MSLQKQPNNMVLVSRMCGIMVPGALCVAYEHLRTK